jgi:hypothetical protein
MAALLECYGMQHKAAKSGRGGGAVRSMHTHTTHYTLHTTHYTPCLQRAWPQVAETKVCKKRQWEGKCNGTDTPPTDLNVRVALELSLALLEPVRVA